MWRESWATFGSGKTIGNASHTDVLGEAGEEASLSLAVAKPAKQPLPKSLPRAAWQSPSEVGGRDDRRDLGTWRRGGGGVRRPRSTSNRRRSGRGDIQADGRAEIGEAIAPEWAK